MIDSAFILRVFRGFEVIEKSGDVCMTPVRRWPTAPWSVFVHACAGGEAEGGGLHVLKYMLFFAANHLRSHMTSLPD